MAKKVIRLYEQFRPENYQLHLVPNRDNMTFNGSVVITGKKVGRPSKRLTFHQNGLKILSASVVKHDKKGDQPIEISRINNQNTLNEVRLHSDAMVFPGSYTVTMEFSGKITRKMDGIYPCYYKHEGKDKALIATQFESHFAREAFPCIDEPEAKATFQLTLVTPANEVVLSNTPIKKQELVDSLSPTVNERVPKTKNQKLQTTFEQTPVMSSYLLAFVYGELHCVSGESKRGVKVSTWANVAQPKSHLRYANKEAIDLLDFFEDYFKTPFPLPKFDQVAIPDFEAMAMENWGLVIGRDVAFLADPINRSFSGERLTTQVIAHELSHMWFGDLVTMKWWDELWLNESFATIMESLGPDRLHPDWQEWEDFTSSRVLGAANRDVYKDVQPVGVGVNHPDEISTLFDPAIVYAKGARILKMLYNYIGDEAFSSGLSEYFKKYAYKNTTCDDLWTELSKSSGKDIGALMTPWINQSGTPELRVKKIAGGVELSQKRFLLDGQDDTLWPIPLLSDSTKSLGILSKQRTDLENSDVPMFNPDGDGHFIVSYQDSDVRQKMLDKIVSKQISPSGRIIAINDMLLQAQKNNLELTEILDLIRSCGVEDRDAVWSVFMRAIGNAQLLTDGDEVAIEKFKAFKQDLASDWYKKLGWEDQPNDDPNIKQLRITAVALSVAGENKQAIEVALDKFNAVSGAVENLPAELRGIIAGAAVNFGDPKCIEQLMREYEACQNPDVRSAITAALCGTRDVKVAKTIENWGMHNFDIIKPQDIDHWFAFLMRNHYTREIAWSWLVSNWDRLTNTIGDKKMEYFIWYASRPISTKSWQKKYTEFFTPKLSGAALKRNIQISLSEIESRVAWREREESKIKNWLEKNF